MSDDDAEGGLERLRHWREEEHLPRVLLPLQNLEQWLAEHGLPDTASYGIGALSESNIRESNQRLEEASAYQESVHQEIFGDQDDSGSQTDSDRKRLLESIKEDETIDVETSTGMIRGVSLKSLATACDTILSLASFRQTTQSKDRLTFSLAQFHNKSVTEFVSIVLQKKCAEDIAVDVVVECCQIARYVQCSSVLDAMVEILLQSIDNANCLSLCQLADQLHLSRLFERCMAQMMSSLGILQKLPLWNDLTPELQNCIVTMEQIMNSSVLNKGNKKLYFASLDEYLAIFAEHVQYYRERLAEAKERQAEYDAYSRGMAWIDAQIKIDKQEERFRTLEAVFREQKEMFAAKPITGR